MFKHAPTCPRRIDLNAEPAKTISSKSVTLGGPASPDNVHPVFNIDNLTLTLQKLLNRLELSVCPSLESSTVMHDQVWSPFESYLFTDVVYASRSIRALRHMHAKRLVDKG